MFCCLFGHKWIHSDYEVYPQVGSTSTRRTCERCGRVDKIVKVWTWDDTTNWVTKRDWERIK